jgi:hypothetical protein
MHLDDGFELSDEQVKELGLAGKVQLKWDDMLNGYQTAVGKRVVSVSSVGTPALLRTTWDVKVSSVFAAKAATPKFASGNLFTCNPPGARENVKPKWLSTARYYCLGAGCYQGPDRSGFAPDIAYFEKAISFFVDDVRMNGCF